MSGHHNRTLVATISLSAAAMAVSACIPQGSGDYRINGTASSGAADIRPTESAPQLVPENEVINTTPSWSPAIVERNSRQVDGGSYMVQPGDTLSKIVSETGASLADIAAENGLSPPYILRVGQRLTIPTGLYHSVNAGETGIAIARAYGVAWSDIVAVNGLEAPYILGVGQRLKLPAGASGGGEGSYAVNNGDLSPEQRAARFSLNIDDVVTGSEPAFAQTNAGLPSNPIVRTNFAAAVDRPAAFGGRFAWPLSGATISSFGSKGGGKVNDGINIAAELGTAVGASGDGVVVYSGNEIGVFGGLVLVDHGGGWVTAYGHLGELTVARGDKVKAGQKLGSVGETGYVDRPQLHFEIRRDRKPVDPVTMLPAR
ncbi:peptidoglycan DD-metalloendopeptidase family protein [Sphingorhabdus arenilitoris]|uniref:Peptidoglycan DD-metalloendopeptidase family protein n=1 Tax=Sphingorhabdus arenilitoris TaxID=1490041 RepID=A0ABV8RE00_9SPHN